MTRKESDLQLCLDVKVARSWKKQTKLDTVVAKNVLFCCFKLLAQFKLPTFNGTTPTVQNYLFVGFWKVLYLRTNSVVVCKIERNLKPGVLVAVDRCKPR